MDIFEILLKIVVVIGVPSVIGAFIYCGKKLEKIDNVDTKVGNLEKIINKIKHNIQVICNSLTESPDINFDHGRLQSFSPLRLTEKGMKYLREDVKFLDIFNENKQDFFNYLNSEEPKTKFEVEQTANKSILFLFNKEYIKPIKIYLYNNPNENLQSLSQVAGVYVRDKYLEEHPEIKE